MEEKKQNTKMKIRGAFLTLATAGVILLSTECSNKRNLEQQANTSGRSLTLTKVWEKPNYIDSNLLQNYKINYQAPGLIGKVMKSEFGYFKDNKFNPTKYFFPRNIEKPEKIFNSNHPYLPDYYWKLLVKKPRGFKENILKTYSRGMETSQKIPGTNLNPDMVVFPTKDFGDLYEAVSQKTVLVWNPDINGQYKDLDISDFRKNPSKHLYLVQSIPKPKKPK